MSENFKAGFFKTLLLLEDYLPEIIIGGGWAPMIYYHYLLHDKAMNPIHTADIDFMVNGKVPLKGDKTVHQLLLDAGFTPETKTINTHPPVIHYEANLDGYDIEVEFLTELTGARDVDVIEVQKGLNAEALRYISISVNNTVEIEIDDIEGRESPLKVMVPSPEAYVFHKGLIFVRRKDVFKKAKDLYYIFEILVYYYKKYHAQMNAELMDLKGRCPEKWFKRFMMNLEKYFPDTGSEGANLVLGQRPANAFLSMSDEQFKQYVLFTFQDFVSEIQKM